MTYALIIDIDKNTQMNSKTPTVLHKLCGKPILEHIIDTFKELYIEAPAVISKNPEIEQYIDGEYSLCCLDNTDNLFYAIDSFLSNISDDDSTVIIIPANMPLITAKTLNTALVDHELITVVSPAAEILDSSSFINILIVNTKVIRLAVKNILNDSDNSGKDSIRRIFYDENTKLCTADPDEMITVCDRAGLADAEKICNHRQILRIMKDGVTVIDPDNTYIGADAVIGKDTVIYPGCHIEGNTAIGEDCVIGPDTSIKNSTVGTNSTVERSVLVESAVGNNTSVGPFAYMRPNSKVGNNVKIGDFVEIKNSSIDDGTKVSHLTYVGDADVGKRVNFGCGTVTVNYDGVHKHRTTIGDDAFIGCNTNLVSPVKVNNGAYTAAGSTITEEVPENALAIARSRQIVKENWVTEKRKKR